MINKPSWACRKAAYVEDVLHLKTIKSLNYTNALCHLRGKTLSRGWQSFAMCVAKLCQHAKTIWQYTALLISDKKNVYQINITGRRIRGTRRRTQIYFVDINNIRTRPHRPRPIMDIDI